MGFRYEPVLLLRDPVTRELVQLMGPRILALGVIKINTLVGTNLASRLETGSVSALNLAWQLMQVPETVIATAIATAVFPTLAQHAASGQRDALRGAMSSALRAILLLCVPALVGLLLLGRPLVEVLYQGGRFNAQSTNAVVWALNFYALGLIGHSFLEIGARVFYAQKDTLTPLFAAVAAMALNALLALTLMNVLGHGGIALANALAVSFEVATLLVIANRRLGGIHAAALGGIAVRAVLGGALMAGLIWIADQVVDSSLVLLGIGASGSAAYLAVIWLMGVPEARAGLRTVMDLPRRIFRPATGVP
jgi:putative peptidoglycan lipid II flippase